MNIVIDSGESLKNPGMDVSVIIINYNTYELTCACIDSIIKHTKDITYEIVLVDNASTDNDPFRFQDRFSDIKLVRNNENLGYAGGINSALQFCKGKVILILNSDIEFKEDAITNAFNQLESDKSIGALSIALEYPTGQVQHICQRFSSIGNELFEIFRLYWFYNKQGKARVMLGHFFDHRTIIYPDWVWGAFFMIPKDAVSKLPARKMPDDFFMYYEDVDWCYNLKILGYKICYYPEAKAIHHVAASADHEHHSLSILKKIVPNEFSFYVKYRNKAYAKILFFLKGVKFITLRKKIFRQTARQYFRFSFGVSTL